MLKSIAKTDLYSIEVDTAKNRGYLTFNGYCKSSDDIPRFLDDVKKACNDLRDGFTLLTDATNLKTPPTDVSLLHEKSQQIWIQEGLFKTAEIIPESALVKLTLNRFSKSTGMKKKEFDNKADAEAWLDSEEI